MPEGILQVVESLVASMLPEGTQFEITSIKWTPYEDKEDSQ